MRVLYFFFAFLMLTNIFAGDTPKTQVDVSNLPARGMSATQDWIDRLEREGHLINVPQDVIDLWRGALAQVIRPSDVIQSIMAYNTVEPKTMSELKTEFRLRGNLLPDGHYQSLLSRWRSYEQYGDNDFLADMESYKQRLAFLDTLTDDQWSYLSAADIADFTDPVVGYELEGFKDLVGWYAPLVDVPAPAADFAKFYVFKYASARIGWPILIVVDNNKGAWDVVDQQSSFAKLQYKFVADDGTETILRTTDFGTNAFYNMERDLFFIPPKSGRLYYRYHDFCVASNSDVRKDGDWAGGIAITHGYLSSEASTIAAGNISSATPIPIASLGDPAWDIDAYFLQSEREYQEMVRRTSILANEINPLRKKMGAELYPEDFYTETLTHRNQTGYYLDPDHAPQWALDGQKRLKEFFSNYEIATVMNGIRKAAEKNRGYTWGDIAQLSLLSAPKPESSQQWRDRYNEWLASEAKRKERLKKRRAEIVAKRAGTVEETSWEWEKRLNDALVAAKLAGDQAEITRLEAEIAAGYSPVATNQQQQVAQGSDTLVDNTPQGEEIYSQVKVLVNKLKKALEQENLFHKADFNQFRQSIKDNNMLQAFKKLNDYQAAGGKRVDRAVKRLRNKLKSTLVGGSLNLNT